MFSSILSSSYYPRGRGRVHPYKKDDPKRSHLATKRSFLAKAVDKRTRNNLYMRLDLVGGELDQVESMWGQTWWGRTRHGAKLAATRCVTALVAIDSQNQ